MEDYRSDFTDNSEFIASIGTEDADVVTEFESNEDYSANLAEANEFTLETDDNEQFDVSFTESIGSGGGGEHNDLDGRQDNDCHPMSSITNLNTTLSTMNSTIITRFVADETDIDNLQSDSLVVRGRLDAVETTTGTLTTNLATVTQRLTAAEADIDTLDANKISASQADLAYARIDRTNINKAWVENLLVQGEIIAQSGQIFYLNAVKVNASSITTGTLDVQRLIITDSQTGEKYVVTVNGQGQTVYEKIDANLLEDESVVTDKIADGAITVDKITANNIVGTGGWINMANGTFDYENASQGTGISWNGSVLDIKCNTLTIGGASVPTQADIAAVQADATTAINNAASAQTTADSATTVANSATTLANNAQTTANNALSGLDTKASASDLTALQGTVNTQAQTIAQQGTTINNVNSYMTFTASNGLYVGSANDAIKTRMNSDSFAIVTGSIGSETELAEFNENALEVKNVETDNEVGFFEDWAIRKGNEVTVEGVSIGYNLNDIWIGGGA